MSTSNLVTFIVTYQWAGRGLQTEYFADATKLEARLTELVAQGFDVDLWLQRRVHQRRYKGSRTGSPMEPVFG